MECKACGHKHDIWNEDLFDENRPFIRINGQFSVTEDTGFGFDTERPVDIFACPNCLTLRIE